MVNADCTTVDKICGLFSVIFQVVWMCVGFNQHGYGRVSGFQLIVAIGSVLIPEMERNGYDGKFSCH